MLPTHCFQLHKWSGIVDICSNVANFLQFSLQFAPYITWIHWTPRAWVPPPQDLEHVVKSDTFQRGGHGFSLHVRTSISSLWSGSQK